MITVGTDGCVGLGVQVSGCVDPLTIGTAGCVDLGGNTDPCNGCCSHFWVAFGKMPSGAALTTDGDGNKLLDMTGASGAFPDGSTSLIDCSCVEGVLFATQGGTTITISLSPDGIGRWILEMTINGGTLTVRFRSAAGYACPPMAIALWEPLSIYASDSGSYLLQGLNCCDDTDPGPPSAVKVQGFQLIVPDSGDTYTGASHHPDWSWSSDFLTNYLSDGWFRGNDTDNIVTFTFIDSSKFDVTLYYSNIGLAGSEGYTINFDQAAWYSWTCHLWNGDIYIGFCNVGWIVPYHLHVGAVPP